MNEKQHTDLARRIQERRNDRKFMARLQRHIDDCRAVLARLTER